jgi:hypothetical protein
MHFKLKLMLIFISTAALNLFSQQTASSFTIPSKVRFAGEEVRLERNDFRERFDREQITIAYHHSVSLLWLKRANNYFPIIEPILKEQGVPDDFKYLSMIESNFDPRALSPAKAAGIWQLMPDTGREYGLEVTDEVDERYHIEKATVAACKYLKAAYLRYGNWLTVAASYNAGMERIGREMEKQKTNDVRDLLLASETSRYIFRLMAAKQFVETPQKFGYRLLKDDFYPRVRTREVEVSGAVDDWADWAEKYDISYLQLKDQNCWLRDRKLTNKQNKTYKIKIPLKEDISFDAKKITLSNPVWTNGLLNTFLKK